MMKYCHELTNGIIWYLKGILKKREKLKTAFRKATLSTKKKELYFFVKEIQLHGKECMLLSCGVRVSE